MPIPSLPAWKKVALVVSLILWVACLGAGSLMLNEYSNSASGTASPVAAAKLKIPLPPGQKYTAIMFVHPRCPCTRSAIAELGRISATCGDRLQTVVYFYKPEGRATDWAKTDLWGSAARISDVQIHIDPSAEVARSYSVVTSGQVLLYDPKGRLLFSGGVTPSRGHQGDSPGKQCIIDRVVNARHSVQPFVGEVYGCRLLAKKPAGGSRL